MAAVRICPVAIVGGGGGSGGGDRTGCGVVSQRRIGRTCGRSGSEIMKLHARDDGEAVVLCVRLGAVAGPSTSIAFARLN